MEVDIFAKILNDPAFFNYRKMQYKYSQHFNDCLTTLKDHYYLPLMLKDFDQKSMVLIQNTGLLKISSKVSKCLLKHQTSSLGIRAAEEEILATSAIEDIDFSRDSVRRILAGSTPSDDQEIRIAGLKKGLEFIADAQNQICEENLYHLYQMTVGQYLDEADKLKDGCYYRNDAVYVVGDRIEHSGAPWKKIPVYMYTLFQYINDEDETDDLIKAAIIHFALAYIHPWFDGNGRMARLLHLWFLVQKGYCSALFMPFSSNIAESRKDYYRAFTQIEENRSMSGFIDVTPFVYYFIKSVYQPAADAEMIFLGNDIYENQNAE